MFFHGGGWSSATSRRTSASCAISSWDPARPGGFVEYDRSPGAHYPVAINQAYAATKWVAAHGDEIGVDGRRLAVVSNSVGGNMAAVVSLMAKSRGTPNIRFQLLLWPVANARFDPQH
jgi:acetyl esterase